jgi:tetratricopeptide (TPR) repeat protein
MSRIGNSPDKVFAEGTTHFSNGRFAQAEDAFRKTIRISPKHANAHNFLGLCLRRAGKLRDATACFKRALEIEPNFTAARINWALTTTDLGRLDESAQLLLEAVEREPTSVEAYFQLGILFQNRFLFEEALNCYRILLGLKRDHALSFANMGAIFMSLGRLEEARASYQKALTLNPQIPSAYDGLAVLAEDEGRIDEAYALFDKAISVDPEFPSAHFNRGAALLRRGVMDAGLKELEWRWQLKKLVDTTKWRSFSQPRWEGQDIAGQGLLIWGEQGIGDEIRLVALVDDVQRRGAKVVVECEGRLLQLFARSFPDVAFVKQSDPPAKETSGAHLHFQSPAESLIQLTRPTLAAFPKPRAYLRADKQRAYALRAQAKGTAEKSPVVGVSWGSRNLRFELGKSALLLSWGPILKLKGFTFIDLQYGDTAQQREAVARERGIALTHLPDLDLTRDIDGLAALISACDLVITVSNTTAHLAGALGVPTWVMLPFGHFQPWYWFSERTDSPWYPSVKLYRQRSFDDWPHVIKQIAKDLKGWTPASRD